MDLAANASGLVSPEEDTTSIRRVSRGKIAALRHARVEIDALRIPSSRENMGRVGVEPLSHVADERISSGAVGTGSSDGEGERVVGEQAASNHLEPKSGTVAVSMADSSDQALVARVQQGDRAAFTILFREYRVRVARVVARFVKPSEVEDVVQDVFLHVHRSIGTFRGESRFSTWMYRLALNVARMHVRKLASRPKFAPETEGGEAPDLREGLDPEGMLLQDRRLHAFRQALSTLAEKKREVFVLHDLEGMQAKDIAELVDAPVLTVRTRLFYARKDLFEAMKEHPELRDLAQALARGGGETDAKSATPRAKDGHVPANRNSVPEGTS